MALSSVLQAGACPHLQHLDIELSEAGEPGIMALGSALQAGACPYLQHLDFGGNEAG